MGIDLFEIIQQYLQISIVLVCLFVGYIIKVTVSNEKVHKFIPLIVAIIGLVASIWVDMASGAGVTLDTIVVGLASGLASTGLYELFHQLITRLPELTEDNNAFYTEEEEEEDFVPEQLKGDHFERS